MSPPQVIDDGDIRSQSGMIHSMSITGVDEFVIHEAPLAAKNESPPSPFQTQGLTNLCSASKGARVLFATDEWFASADCLLKDGPPTFDEHAYCEQGKVMDGWETRRRREAGHDWSIIKLASRASISGIEIDTAHFTGNHVPAISIQLADFTSTQQEAAMVAQFPGALDRLLHGCLQGTGASPAEVEQAEFACAKAGVEWNEVLPKTPLRPGYEKTRMHYFTLQEPVTGTHIRVNYFPDGGVARLRMWGSPLHTDLQPSPKPRPAYSPIKTGRTCSVIPHSTTSESLPSQQPYPYPEISSLQHGGNGLGCSNRHYGDPVLLIQPTLGRDMGDGWETARHPNRPSILVRNPETNLVDSNLSDWCIIKLGVPALNGVVRIILDTKHFRGNYPESTLVEGCYIENDDQLLEPDDTSSVDWFTLIPRGRMAPDAEHVYDLERNQIMNATLPVSHIKVHIFPDGGLSRVRVYGDVNM